jgi:hypothetical protein
MRQLSVHVEGARVCSRLCGQGREQQKGEGEREHQQGVKVLGPPFSAMRAEINKCTENTNSQIIQTASEAATLAALAAAGTSQPS